MEGYKPRIVDALLERKLQGKGAVLIEGPKWCGKTTTATRVAGSVSRLIDTKKMKAPSFMMVLTGTGAYAYRRKDGVYVVPIGSLRD